MVKDGETGDNDQLDESWQPIGASLGSYGTTWRILYARRMTDGSWEYQEGSYKPMSIDNLIENNTTEDTDSDH